MIPHRTPFLLPLLYPSLTWRVPITQRELYLTFDDGPFPGPTDFVLSELKNASAQATFFCIGDNITKYPQLFTSIIDHGHAVANHTFNHVNGWQTDVNLYRENIKSCQYEMDKIAPPDLPLFFRPPYGKITRSQIRSLPEYKIIMWDVLSKDYNKNLDAQKCLRNTIEATRPGSIIVFHDSVKAERNLMYVLPRFIDYFTEKGFAFKKLEHARAFPPLQG